MGKQAKKTKKTLILPFKKNSGSNIITNTYTKRKQGVTEVTEVNETFAEDSSSVSGGVGGGLDGGEGLFVHHLPGEETSRIRKMKPTK